MMRQAWLFLNNIYFNKTNQKSVLKLKFCFFGEKMKDKIIDRLKKDIAFFVLAILAGLMIAIGAIAYLYITSFDSSSIWLKIAGGVAFTIGLLFIIMFEFKLFTGLNCDLINMKYKDWYKLIVSFLGNCVGCWFGALLMFKTPIGADIMTRAIEVSTAKLAMDWWVVLLSGVMCGIFITMAVLGNRACKNSRVAGMIAIIFPILIFVILGVEHSVANQVYFALATLGGKPFSGQIVLHTFLVMIGNIIGGVLIPLALFAKDKLIGKSKNDKQLEEPASINEDKKD